ncbi:MULTISPECIES: ABC transporter ATP-binding protein [Pseudomonadota]|jgi:putative spermidine/putrescine transport system ATP-binding protein|uniref:ABC transporter related protein n=1 Tax=Chelativorans sp. (strain BNC1) TaxID=266779 RepID=Q11H68_CHESB|nr:MULTISPECIES: ABC transporter ATP-binding protein [Chelativorans]
MPDFRNTSALKLENIRKTFGSVEALSSINLEVSAGEFLTILGPSGSGKTTLLRLIAGFVTPDSGSLTIFGEDMTMASAGKRQIGMVFQNYALFPHLTVLENVMFPLEMRKHSRREAAEKAAAALAAVHLDAFGDRYPKQISGGQQQRVALARAVVFEPKLLLLDEPFSALDRRLRESMQREVRQLQASLNLTTIFITHDQEEALFMSDRIAVIDGGTIQQLGTPNEIYYHPRSITVAEFIGDSNILEGTETPDGLRTRSGMLLRRASSSNSGRVLIRPEAIRISREPADGVAMNQFKGKIANRTFVGGFTIYQVDVHGGDTLTVRCLADEETMFDTHQEVHLSIREADCRPVPRDAKEPRG